MNVVVFDTRVGNLHSLCKAIEAGGARVRVEADPARLLDGDALVLPGVGAFGAAAGRLAPAAAAVATALRDGFPALGICLGMQLLLDASEEGAGAGLGVIAGRVRRLRAPRVPHMGWNAVEPVEPADPIFAGAEPLIAYYANSYVAEPADAARVIAWTEYGGERFPAAVRAANAWGVQFHPEKSGAPGLRLLRNFLRQAGAVSVPRRMP
ncbi:MAG TPA: imidazole glycerol phosphate synthase subunit HisH [Longimicrobiales bacterium]